jgi:hypothetical protein
MVRRWLYATMFLAVVAALHLMGQSASAQIRESGPADLFYNYYVPPAGYASVGAQLYPSPRPTPPLVGHTYVTYQPLMPQEFMYEHMRAYWRVNPDCSLTRTTVCWKHCPPLCPFLPSMRWSLPAPCTPPAGPGSSCQP